MTDAPNVPGGSALERLLMAAAVNERFAEMLALHPQAAAESAGISLSVTELELLDAMEPAKLKATLAALAAQGVVLSYLTEPPPVCTGIRPDRAPEEAPDLPHMVSLGIRPDRGPDEQSGVDQDRFVPPAGSRPNRTRRIVIAAAATTAVVGAGVAAFTFTAGSRPHRKQTPPPQPPPDAGTDDASVDGGKDDDP